MNDKLMGNSFMDDRDLPQIQQRLADFLHQHTDVCEDFALTTDLIDAGILDSLLVTDLVLFVSRTFAVELTARDISPEHMGSVERMARLVQDKLAKRSRAA